MKNEEMFSMALELAYEAHRSNPHIYSHALAVAALGLRYEIERLDPYLVSTIGILHHVLDEGADDVDIARLFGNRIALCLINLKEKDIDTLSINLPQTNQLVIWVSFLDKLAELREYHYPQYEATYYISYKRLLHIYEAYIPSYLLDEMTYLIESHIGDSTY